MVHKKINIRKMLIRIFWLIFGAFLASVGLEIFLIPNNVIDGGVTGVSIIANHFSNIPLGIFLVALNLPFLILGYKQLGKTFALSTLFSVACLAVGVSVLHPVPGITKSELLAPVFGGVILGAGVGIIIRNGGSLDGTEIMAIILGDKLHFSVGQIIMFFNLFILGGSGFVYGWDSAMYSLFAYFIAFKVIDIVVEGIDEARMVIIVSEKFQEITDAIIQRLGRRVTLLHGQGAKSGEPENVIYLVVTRLEIAKLKSIVNTLDAEALVTIGNVEVSGRRFKKRAIH